MKAERYESGPVQYQIRGLEDDMGTGVKMDLVIEEDGDAILSLTDLHKGQSLEIQFCTGQGGTQNPGVSGKLRELAELIVKAQE